MGNKVQIHDQNITSLRDQISDVHEEMYNLIKGAIYAVECIHGKHGLDTPAIAKFYEFFEMVETDVLSPMLIYSNQIGLTLDEIKTEIYKHDV